MHNKKVILSAIGKDRPGIVSEVAGILYQRGSSIEDSSMTILEGEFSMLMIVTLPGAARIERLQRIFRPLGKRLGLTVSIQTLKDRPRVGPLLHRGTPHMLSVLGKDRPGIVHRVAKLLANHKINITDLNTKVIGHEGGPNVYAMVVETEVPPTLARARFTRQLKQLAKSLNVKITFKPIETLGL